jgi:hypothetical protein
MLTKIAAIAAVTGLVASAQAAILAQWTFETSIPTTAGPHVAELGVNASTSNALGGTGGTYSNPAGFGSIESFSSNAWDAGDFYQFSTPTLGFQGITFALAHTGSNTGPRDFAVQYSTDGTTFTSFGSYTVTNDAWNTTITPPASLKGAFAAPAAVDNLALVYFRVTQVGTTSVNGGTVASAGTSRVDDVTIRGVVIPEPATLGLLAGAGILALRRRA